MRFFLILLFASVSCLSAEPRAVTPPPDSVVAEFKLDPAYQQCVMADGLPIVSRAGVELRALLEAAWLIDHMLAVHPEIRAAMVKNHVRFGVMAHNEYTTSIPEHATLIPHRYWDRRARGLGASAERPVVSCGAENLLCLPGDPYGTENILIHEFAHAIHHMGLSATDPTFNKRLEQAYKSAMTAGLWKGKYASVNPAEYWAEATQSWFDTNRENDHDHNHVNTRAELKEYDPAVAALCSEIYGDTAWRYQRPELREAPEHFKGWDFAKAPKFAWPKEFDQWTETSLADPNVHPEGLQELEWKPLGASGKAPASTDAGAGECSLLIANASGKEVSISWVNFKGGLEPHGSVRNKFVSIQETHPGHVFLIAEEDGTPIGYAAAKPGDGRVIVPEKASEKR